MGRIVTPGELPAAVEAERRAGRRIVFTNGCFDLLHPGHVRYLEDARRLGDTLVVGINSDDSVRRLGKGVDRPVMPEEARAEVVAALGCVSWVCLFEQDTPIELIRLVEPDVLVKGGDWRPDQVAGADIVSARGGQVTIVPFHGDYSTTAIVDKIRNG